MIAKMKKVRILALKKNKHEVTSALGELGTLHVETRDAKSPDLDRLSEVEARFMRAIQSIPVEADAGQRKYAVKSVDEVNAIAEAVLARADELKSVMERADKLTREINRVQAWGNFDPELASQLEEQGVKLTFAYVTKDQLGRLPEDLRYIMVKKSKDRSMVVILDEADNIDAEVFRLPEQSLESLLDELSKARNEQTGLEKQLADMAAEKAAVEAGQKLLKAEQEFAAVEASLEEVSDLDLICEIEGFQPADSIDALKNFAAKQGLGLVIEDPSDDDAVPTKLDNPRAVGIIKPVFDFMGTTPGYKEQDISVWFLLFFTLFFAMIIGDAGYGAILSIVALFFTVKMKVKNGRVPDAIILFDVMSLATVVWGAVTGNWFGYAPIADLPILNQLVIPALDSFEVENATAVTQMIQLICFVIGLVHLVLAHTLAFIKKIQEKPHIHAFADLGWMTAIIGLFFLVLNVVISVDRYPVPSWAIYLIGGGIVAVLLFSGQEGDGFFKGVARALGDIINIALSGVSAFADVISYIRLFAVGLASIEIAKSFNDMATGMMDSGAGGIIGGILVLALGHTLNLVMGALSVVVHGIRLKMLEFSSHLGNEWAGFEYKPFKNLATLKGKE